MGRVVWLARSRRALRAVKFLMGHGLLLVDALGTGMTCVLLCIGVIGRAWGGVGSRLMLLLSPLGLLLLLLVGEALRLVDGRSDGSGDARGFLDVTAVLGPLEAEVVGNVGKCGDVEQQHDGTDAGYSRYHSAAL